MIAMQTVLLFQLLSSPSVSLRNVEGAWSSINTFYQTHVTVEKELLASVIHCEFSARTLTLRLYDPKSKTELDTTYTLEDAGFVDDHYHVYLCNDPDKDLTMCFALAKNSSNDLEIRFKFISSDKEVMSEMDDYLFGATLVRPKKRIK